MPDTPNGFDKPQKRQGRFKAKGRQVDSERLSFVTDILQPHLEGGPLKRDRLIEYLHILQDKIGHLAAADLAALAELMLLPMAEIWEVASFYDHFDLIKE
ncbi:MAG: NAD(P)H-dependent oxidoreductase subunit E, partial [Pseudomonadota bacterium]|nr:NAD(P)H-dependent oxidoreductase subunit E [Pseudomonadota bacterium]